MPINEIIAQTIADYYAGYVDRYIPAMPAAAAVVKALAEAGYEIAPVKDDLENRDGYYPDT